MSKKHNKKKQKEKEPRGFWTDFQRKFLTRPVIRTSILVLVSLAIIILSLYWLPGDLHYRITETYQFSGNESGSLTFVVLLPTTGQYQEVFEPEITWPGTVEEHQDGRLQVVRLTTDLRAGESVEAQIAYSVHLWQGKAVWYGELMNPEDLSATPEIQSDDPAIQTKAEELRVNNNQRRTARKIFEFTNQHLKWPDDSRINPDISALDSLQSGIGGCTERACLMAALSRAEGIPTRVITGLAMPDSIPFVPISEVWNHPAGAHAWVETYFDHTWHFADPSWANQFLKRDLFGWVDGLHLAFDEIDQENAVYAPLIAEAEENGTWIAAMNAPLRFVAYSNLSFEEMQFIPEVTLRKVWDSRYLLFVSLILILWILSWVARDDQQVKTSKK
ncbi:MAG: transglutaminase-like domain-containing protein [Brevefilum sp.]